MVKNKFFLLLVNIIIGLFILGFSSVSALVAVDCTDAAGCTPGGTTDGYNKVIVDDSLKFGAFLKEGVVYTYWKSFNKDEQFKWYKVVRSTKNSNPVYPDDGYIKYSDKIDDTEYKDYRPLDGISYYRICAITHENNRYCSNVVKIYNDKLDDKPTVCTSDYTPVCGYKNGLYKTYSNKCMLNSDNAYYKYYGECKDIPTTICSTIYAPVCGYKDNKYKTYPSKCTLTADKAYYKYNGECRDTIKPIACTKEYAPVCGYKNGKLKTYSNKCLLGVDKAYYKYSGECRDTISPGLSIALKQKAKNLINNFIKKLDSKGYSNEKKITIIEGIITKLNILEEKKPKSSAIINYLVDLLKEKISQYSDDFSEIEDIFDF